MTRTRLILFVAAAASVGAQTNRDAYRIPYKTWRETAPELERDAGAPTPEFSQRLDASARFAQDYFNARVGFLTTPVEQLRWLQAPFVPPAAVLDEHPEVKRLLGVASDYLTKTIGTFGSVKDPAIQQVRQAMERERAALAALTESINTRDAGMNKVTESVEDADALRAGLAQSLAIATSARARLADQLKKESSQWSNYYRDLADGALARPTPSATPSSATGATATSPPIVTAAPVKPASAPRTAGQFPLARYTGEWVFPNRGLFYGAQPETIDLVVNEENGRMFGTLSARFILSVGNTNDPVLRFTFEGQIQPGRSQTLALKTESGATGSIELIPGSAFNLLEVTFETGPAVNKIRSGNFVLLKR